MKVTLIISSLNCGGAERVMSVLANYLAQKSWKVSLITLNSSNNDFYKLHYDINRIDLDVGSRLKNKFIIFINIVRYIIKIRQKILNINPDLVISFIDFVNVLTLIASIGLAIPVLISERTDIKKHRIGFIISILRRLFYPFAYRIILQSEYMKSYIQKILPVYKVSVIPNPVVNIYKKKNNNINTLCQGFTIVAIGRFDPVKGFDLLIRAFAKCAEKYSWISLLILGEGKERRTLEKLTAELGLTDRVIMPGRVYDPMEILHHCNLFVLSSRYEGFPNALLEAMVCGLPVIATNCSESIQEIVRDGVDGILVPPEDIDSLSSTIETLLLDRDLSKRIAARATDVNTRFSIQKIMNKWEKLIVKAAKN